MSGAIRVGLISDTHGLLRPEATAFLSGCNLILHGGDIGNSAILEELEKIAPLKVVCGNNDRGPWAQHLRETELISVGAVMLYLIHNVTHLEDKPPPAGVRVVVSGHSHQPMIEQRGGILFVNPGSSGPRRFKLPVSAGELTLSEAGVDARIVDLITAQTLLKT
jgi:uncharacterized protein